MQLGTIEIRNDGTALDPTWSIECENDVYRDEKSLDEAVEWIRAMKREGHTVDAICLELED